MAPDPKGKRVRQRRASKSHASKESEGTGPGEDHKEPDVTADFARQAAATQALIKSLSGATATADFARQAAATQALIKSLSGATATADFARQAAAYDELVKGLSPRIASLSGGSGKPADSTRQSSVPQANPASGFPRPSYLARHAPKGWEGTKLGKRVLRAIENHTQLPMVVAAADIRRSTDLMKEARDPYEFASILSAFAEESREVVWKQGGLFDKFTGDGFLAYWPFTTNGRDRSLKQVFATIQEILSRFEEHAIPRLRANSQNYPGDVGLAIGVDEGPAFVATVAGALTIVGHSVVGAVRMEGAAGPGETVINTHLGEHLLKRQESAEFDDIELVPVVRDTKDYQGQSVFALRLL